MVQMTKVGAKPRATKEFTVYERADRQSDARSTLLGKARENLAVKPPPLESVKGRREAPYCGC